MTMTEPSLDTEPPDTRPLKPLSTAAEQTWAKLRDVRARKKDLDDQEKELSAQLRTELGRGEFVPSDGGPPLTIFPTRRFDAEQAARILPAHILAKVQRITVDAKALKEELKKEKLPAELYSMCQVDGDKDTVRELK
jgi:hypothetical protein